MNTESKISFDRARIDRLARFNPIRGLTPEKLASDMANFEAGYLGPFARLMEAIKNRDDVLKVVAPKREGAPARRNWEILISPNLTPAEEAEAQKHKEALEFFYNNLTVTNGIDLNQRGGVRLLIRQMLQAIGYKYAVHNIVWKPTPDGLTAEMIFAPLWFFENRTGKLRFLEQEFDFDGRELEEGAWMVTVGEGIMEASAVAYMFKHLPLKDWLILSQDFGKPFVEGISDAEPGSEQWNTLKAAVDAFMADLRIVRSRSAEIKITEVSRAGDQPYGHLVERMDRALSRLWRGADLSTMSSGHGAEGRGASLQAAEADLLEEDDAQLVNETANSYLDNRVINYTYGEGTRALAYFKIIIPPKQDVDKDLKVDEFLLKAGAPLGEKATLERYGRELPDPKDKLLTAPVGPLPGDATIDQAANEDQTGFLKTALDAYAQAEGEDLQPFFERVQGIFELGDMQLVSVALQKLRTDYPQFLQQISATERVVENALSAELLNGMARAAVQQTQIP